MFLEIFIYLVIAFGTLVLCITMLEKDNCFEQKYIVIKNEKIKVRLTIETEGLTEEEAKTVGWIIRKGKYQDVYDVVSNFKIINK